MSTYVLMRILESAPGRYDRGIQILTLGRLDAAYSRLTSRIGKGEKVLDIGCGTGALTIRAAERGARVKGIDVNPQMLEIAKKKVEELRLGENVDLREMGVAELAKEEEESYDVVMSALCFSELTEDEISYALKEIQRILKPGGLLLIADEVRPGSIVKRLLSWLLRVPLSILTYFLTQRTSKALKNLPERIEKEGFFIESLRLNRIENFVELVARKPEQVTK